VGWIIKPLCLAFLLLTSACAQAADRTKAGPPASATADASTSASLSPLRPAVFAVFSRQPATTGVVGTVSIVDRGGRVHATQTFQVAQTPDLACGEAGYIAPAAFVAGNSVYFLDTSGALRSLSQAGAVKLVTQLAAPSRERVTWFAVSPDGKKVLASELTFPPLQTPASSVPSCPTYQAGPVQLTLEAAASGDRAPHTILTRTLSLTATVPSSGVIAPVAWDGAGAVATLDTTLAGGLGMPTGERWTSKAAHLTDSGQPGAPLGGPGCLPLYGEVDEGTVVCYTSTVPTIRTADGRILWSLKAVTPDYFYGNVFLSPSGGRAAFALYHGTLAYDSSVMRAKNGARLQLPAGFIPQGWLDENTIIGSQWTVKNGQLELPQTLTTLNAQDPGQKNDLGLSADFLGVLSSG
jgi:hypothetical protein